MKKTYLLLFCLFLSLWANAIVSITIDLTTAGTLSSNLTSDELSTVTNLKITGPIDNRDFLTMRDNMPVLTSLDISSVQIVALGYYSEGANTIPSNAFSNKITLQEIKLPNDLVGINYNSFEACGLLTISLPNTIKFIKDLAFYNCGGLTGSLTLPHDLESIGYRSFGFCSSLIGDLIIPNKVKTIGKDCFISCSGFNGNLILAPNISEIPIGAFWGCNQLLSVSFPESLIIIKNGAFYRCTKLKGPLIFPEGLVTIEQDAFKDCYSINGNLSLPSTLRVIGNDAFSGCRNLKDNLVFPSSIIAIGAGAFNFCYSFTGELNIPRSTTNIAAKTYENCQELLSLVIPNTIKSIGSHAFMGCYALTSITTHSLNPIDLSTSPFVFSGVNKNTCTLYVPIGTKLLYENADQWKDFLNIVERDATSSFKNGLSETIKLYSNHETSSIVITGITGNTIVSIIDINGNILSKKSIYNESKISIEHLPQALYLINISNDNNTLTKKIIKR